MKTRLEKLSDERERLQTELVQTLSQLKHIEEEIAEELLKEVKHE